MLYLEAQTEPTQEQLTQITNKSIFLSGGITNVENWQVKAIQVLSQFDDLYIINPRNKNFEKFKKEAGYEVSRKQIEWEHRMLSQITQVLFWFSYETVQPITLYELGAKLRERRLLNDDRRPTIFIGVHPDYERIFDVKIQTSCEYPELVISNSLDGLLQMVVTYNKVLLIGQTKLSQPLS